MKITGLSQLDLNPTYGYADYLTWQLEDTVELIKGKIMAISPAQNLKHQRISRNLLLHIGNFLHKNLCQVFNAPIDAKLYDTQKPELANQKASSVAQPDLCAICGPAKLTVQGCNGAPDWIIEALSPGNAKKEMPLKYDLYWENGVIEYWLAYPYEQFALKQDSEKYQLYAMFAGDVIAKPYVFPEPQIDLTDVFAE